MQLKNNHFKELLTVKRRKDQMIEANEQENFQGRGAKGKAS